MSTAGACIGRLRGALLVTLLASSALAAPAAPLTRALADTPAFAPARHAGARLDIVATVASGYENRLIARVDRGIRAPADLKGQRIGFVQGTTGQHFTDSDLIFGDIDAGMDDFISQPFDPQPCAAALTDLERLDFGAALQELRYV